MEKVFIMGDKNQYMFIKDRHQNYSGPFLEVGSKDYGNTQNLRGIFTGSDYTGIDMADGPGVDKVLDLTDEFSVIDQTLEGKKFGTIFCLSTLEHCNNPFKMAENISKLMNKGGNLVISVPFAWKIHGYPNDYWRFTPEGIKVLFPGFSFDEELTFGVSSKTGEFKKADDELAKITFNFSKYKKQGMPLRGVSAKFVKSLAKLGLFSWLAGYRYVLAPTNVMMIGKYTP